MNNNSNKSPQVIGPSKGFESIKKLDENGIEYWEARELMCLLGYSEWRSFDEVITKAIVAAKNSNQNTENHFGRLTKMVRTGSNTVRPIKDWKLDRYACYLVAQNGDSHKLEIAGAQTYFAIQTRKQEILDSLPQAERRIHIREGMRIENRFLFGVAKDADVSKFGAFNGAGYRGLYNMSLSEIEKKKNIDKGALLDSAGSVELAANLFRITQIEAKLKRDRVKGDDNAQSTHFKVGAKIRQTMKELGSEMPESLKPEKHIKKLKKNIKNAKSAPNIKGISEPIHHLPPAM